MRRVKSAKSVIKVVIVPKLSLDRIDSLEESKTEESEGLETDSDDDSEKFEVPEIIIDETDEIIPGMKHQIDNSKLTISAEGQLTTMGQIFPVGNKFLTAWQEAARPKQPKLLPDSFVLFINNCKNLIADLRKTMDERLDAGEWILEFDGNIQRLEKEQWEEKERVRKEKAKEEAAKARAEAWWRRRSICRPLANPPPRLTKVREDLVEDGRRCHDRVCPLPLIVLRKRLEKVERKQLAEQTLQEDSRREDFGILTRTALQKMSEGFKAYLAEVRAKVGGVLQVEGTALITVECKVFDTVLQERKEVNVFEKKEVLKEFEKEEVLDQCPAGRVF